MVLTLLTTIQSSFLKLELLLNENDRINLEKGRLISCLLTAHLKPTYSLFKAYLKP